MAEFLTNWSSIYSLRSPVHSFAADDEEGLCALFGALSSGERVRVVGSLCSPNDAVLHSTTTRLIRLLPSSSPPEVLGSVQEFIDEFDRGMVHLVDEAGDPTSRLVSVDGCITLAALQERLSTMDLSLPTLPSILGMTLGGFMAVGGHGTGTAVAAAPDWVVAMRVVTAAGVAKTLVRPDADDLDSPSSLEWRAWCNSLGCLGVVTRVLLRTEARYCLSAQTYTTSFRDSVLPRLDEIAQSADFVRIHWYPHTDTARVWCANKGPLPATVPADTTESLSEQVQRLLLEAALAAGVVADYVLPSALPATWIKAINHFFAWRVTEPLSEKAHKAIGLPEQRNFMTFDCLFSQHVSEWAFDMSQGARVLSELETLVDSHNPALGAHFPVEIRFAAPDDALLSPGRGRPTVWIGIIMYRPFGLEPTRHPSYFDAYARIAEAAGGRPHWAKEIPLTRDQLAALYGEQEYEAFETVRRAADPRGILLNGWSSQFLRA
jgi:L-gulonolactone oxidase